jgi:hypothetical protein
MPTKQANHTKGKDAVLTFCVVSRVQWANKSKPPLHGLTLINSHAPSC